MLPDGARQADPAGAGQQVWARAEHGVQGFDCQAHGHHWGGVHPEGSGEEGPDGPQGQEAQRKGAGRII